MQPAFPPRADGRGEGKLAAPLERHLIEAAPDELVPVVVILRRQVTAADKARLFAGLGTRAAIEQNAERRKRLVAELERVAATEQAGLLASLEGLEAAGQVKDVRPLWIVNAIGVHAPGDVIRGLAAFPEVEAIHLDLPRPAKGVVGWGLTQIHADPTARQSYGYDGTGTVVAVLDTGVDYHHASLAGRMWINHAEDLDGDGQLTSKDANGVDEDGNGYKDDVIGWNFSGSGSNDPADPAPSGGSSNSGHGTHVAGIVAGDDGTNVYGVAPGARIMALREADSSALSTQQESWAGMQYALANGADVVNFSSGWLDAWSPVYASWRDAVDNLMDGGVLFVTIAHNDASPGAPDSVRTPGRVPSALTVGATNNNDTVPSFSNRGPVTWQSRAPFYDYPWPPGLLKPDIAAPGVAVESAKRGGGWISETGTSFAAPHAAGVAALLRQKSPGLSAYELRYLIEESAVDLAPNGPDNSSGWGRIDASAALAASISPAAYDLSITPTGAEWTTADIWIDNDDDGNEDKPMALANNHLYARVRNRGGRVVPRAELKFYYADVSTIGIGGFDPNGDGDPSDGNFTYIGSYVVPILGPSGSKHDTAVGLVNWNIPTPPGTHWCVGVGAVAPAGWNPSEADTANNHAFRNFVELVATPTGALDFQIAPPAGSPGEAFAFEIRGLDLPPGTRMALLVDRSLEPTLFAHATGFAAGPDSGPEKTVLPEEFYEALRRDLPSVSYELSGDRALLSSIVSPHGKPIPARIVVGLPADAELRGEPRLVLSTVDGAGQRVGGLSVGITRGTPAQSGGPFLPK